MTYLIDYVLATLMLTILISIILMGVWQLVGCVT